MQLTAVASRNEERSIVLTCPRHTLLRQFGAQQAQAEHVPPIEVGVQVERPRQWSSNRVGIVSFLLSRWTGCSKRSAAGGAVST